MANKTAIQPSGKQLSTDELLERFHARGPMSQEEKRLALRREIKKNNIPGFAEANARLGGYKLVD